MKILVHRLTAQEVSKKQYLVSALSQLMVVLVSGVLFGLSLARSWHIALSILLAVGVLWGLVGLFALLAAWGRKPNT